MISLVLAAAADKAAFSESAFTIAETSFAAFFAACSAFARSSAAEFAAETASSFALMAPATVLSSFKVDALIGVPSFMGSSFRTSVTISDQDILICGLQKPYWSSPAMYSPEKVT